MDRHRSRAGPRCQMARLFTAVHRRSTCPELPTTNAKDPFSQIGSRLSPAPRLRLVKRMNQLHFDRVIVQAPLLTPPRPGHQLRPVRFPRLGSAIFQGSAMLVAIPPETHTVASLVIMGNTAPTVSVTARQMRSVAVARKIVAKRVLNKNVLLNLTVVSELGRTEPGRIERWKIVSAKPPANVIDKKQPQYLKASATPPSNASAATPSRANATIPSNARATPNSRKWLANVTKPHNGTSATPTNRHNATRLFAAVRPPPVARRATAILTPRRPSTTWRSMNSTHHRRHLCVAAARSASAASRSLRASRPVARVRGSTLRSTIWVSTMMGMGMRFLMGIMSVRAGSRGLIGGVVVVRVGGGSGRGGRSSSLTELCLLGGFRRCCCRAGARVVDLFLLMR